MKEENNKQYLTYIVGSLVFISLAGLTFWLIFKGFKGTGNLILPKYFTIKTIFELLILLPLFYTLDGLRLLFVFKTIGTNVSFFLMIKLIFINVFASGVTPLATGGGFAQIYFLTKNNIAIGTATAATTIRTVIASIIIFTSVPIILITEKGLNSIITVKHGVLFSVLLISIYVVLFYGLVRQKALLEKIIFFLLNILKKVHLLKEEKYNKLKASVDREIINFSESLLSFWKGKKLYLILSILSSTIYLFLLFFFPFVLIKTMNANVHLLTVLSIQVIITFLIYFTPTPGGSGVAEGGFALIFSNFVSASYVAPLTFYWRFLTMYLGMIIGFAVFYKEVWRKDNDSKR